MGAAERQAMGSNLEQCVTRCDAQLEQTTSTTSAPGRARPALENPSYLLYDSGAPERIPSRPRPRLRLVPMLRTDWTKVENGFQSHICQLSQQPVQTQPFVLALIGTGQFSFCLHCCIRIAVQLANSCLVTHSPCHSLGHRSLHSHCTSNHAPATRRAGAIHHLGLPRPREPPPGTAPGHVR